MEQQQLALIDPRFLRPLPQSMWGVACSNCRKTTSRWELHEPQGYAAGPQQPQEEFLALCSHCFLFKSIWAEKRKDQVEKVVSGVEDAEGKKFLRATDGSLLSQSDCDRILASIALISRVVDMRIRNVEPEPK